MEIVHIARDPTEILRRMLAAELTSKFNCINWPPISLDFTKPKFIREDTSKKATVIEQLKENIPNAIGEATP